LTTVLVPSFAGTTDCDRTAIGSSQKPNVKIKAERK
jgi:hypothetical protein